MKRILLLALVLSTMTLADKPTGKWNFLAALPLLPQSTSAWGLDASVIEFEGKRICHYAGQVTIAPDKEGNCPYGVIRHLAKISIITENDKIVGMRCAYDYTLPNGEYFFSTDNIRESCPDIILTVVIDMVPVVVGEYYFQPMENQAKYYQDGKPIRQILPSSREILDRFGKKYENQIRYRDTYDWVMLKPGAGWDQWIRPGSQYGPGKKAEKMERTWK